MTTHADIPYGRQDITGEDIQAVIDILRSDWLTQGPAIARFEQSIADYCGARYAVAVSSGTAALHLACLAANIGPGDRLWTSPNTFVASANCALYCGASPDFVDIDPATYNMGVMALEEKLIKAKRNNTLPKVVIPVHFAGQSCEMERIAELGRNYGFSIIEDASHAIGGKYLGETIGNCRHSDMAVFSFHPVKIITTGEGGMVVTNHKDTHEKLLRLRSHGITREQSSMQGESHGPWYYQQIELGFNYRMTDIQAALGVTQMTRIDKYVSRRHELALRYDRLLSELSLTLPWQHPDAYSAFHLYVLRIKLKEVKKARKQIFEELRAAGLGVNVHYIPVHTQPYYQRLGFKAGDFPVAEEYYSEAMSIPMYFGLTESQQDYVVAMIRKFIE